LKPIRLLPIVIFAALALLVFKGIGLVTNGGYVLTGTQVAVAQEGGGSSDAGGASDNVVPMPSEATMTDANPSLEDTAPTLATKVDAPPEGAPSADGAPGSDGTSHSGSSSDSASSASEAASADQAAACPDAGASSTAPPAASEHEMTDKIGTALTKGCPPVAIAVDANGDAIPTIKDGSGKIVPLDAADGDNSQTALLQRLGTRRDQLDKREADIAMREAVVSAAEQKLDAKTKELADLQAKVAALVDQKQAAEDANFKAIVSMYENMKPKDAAKIFDTLDLSVLIKVAQAMNPRKMSPILAAMSPKPAEALTTAFAVNNSPMPPVNAGENLAALPQIVGH
jgi:flagellar motility protein MotE (MotC chaperone)